MNKTFVLCKIVLKQTKSALLLINESEMIIFCVIITSNALEYMISKTSSCMVTHHHLSNSSSQFYICNNADTKRAILYFTTQWFCRMFPYFHIDESVTFYRKIYHFYKILMILSFQSYSCLLTMLNDINHQKYAA